MNASKTESSVGQGEKFREREEMGGTFILDNIRQHLVHAKYRKKGVWRWEQLFWLIGM